MYSLALLWNSIPWLKKKKNVNSSCIHELIWSDLQGIYLGGKSTLHNMYNVVFL